MKREHDIEEMGKYIFYYPFENDGLNYGTNSISNCFGRMMAYGSGNAEPNFSDTLSFTNFDGKYGVDVGSLAAKPVAKIEGVNLNEIFNDNDFELGMEYVYRGTYTEEPLIFVACRNSSNTNGNGVSITTGNGYPNYRQWIDETRVANTDNYGTSTRVWHSMTLSKTGSSVRFTLIRLDNGSTIINQTFSWSVISGKPVTDSIIVLGDYFPNANRSHNIRWTNGIARELYLKIL